MAGSSSDYAAKCPGCGRPVEECQAAAPSVEFTPQAIKCRQYRHGGARFYTVDENGVERLLADTYNEKATERVAAALNAEVVRMP